MRMKFALALCFGVFSSLLCRAELFAQSLGVELHNMMMPASGGMGGVSIAAPQDLLSAIHANPATLVQFPGTQATFSGGWAEPTFDLHHTGGVLPGVGAFDAKSSQPGSVLGNIGITQDFHELGMPVVMGLGMMTDAGGGVNFIQVPASNGTSSSLVALGFTGGVGVSLTDRLSIGGALTAGNGFYDGPFVGIGSMSTAYALRGAFGVGYQMAERTSLGFYYQTAEQFDFQNAIQLQSIANDFLGPQTIHLALPENLGFGIANSSLMDGNLLVGVDFLYKLWDNAALYNALYDNQFVVQFGTQYTYGNYRLRAGYVWAENPVQSPPGGVAGGIAPPGAVHAMEYVQSQVAVINQNRMTFGIGRKDVLPGLDFDLYGGGMFRESAQLGPFTSVTVESYWVGFGLTWRFGRGAWEELPVPDSWTSAS